MSKILVVDDEATITTQLEERLARMNYQVVGSASSGEEALDLARETRPDIILMDIVMPGKIDGIEAARRINQELDIPVVFLTAYGDDKYIERSKTAEPMGFLMKPYQLNTLKATLEIALYNKSLTRKLQQSESSWRTLLDGMSEALILCEAQGEIYFWNSGAERLFGFSSDEARGKPFLSLLSEGTPRESREAFAAALEENPPGGPEQWLEGIGLRKDWARFPLEFSISPLRTGSFFSLIIVARDVSSQKRREAQLTTSIKERERSLLNIRGKVENHLKLIYDLLNLQSEYLKDRAPGGGRPGHGMSSERLAALLKGLSPATAGTRIDFSIYIRNLVDRLLQVHRVDPEQVEINIRVEDVLLDLQTAIPWGIIIGELVANALKHAFPEGRSGAILVELRETGPGAFRLIVGDNGIGIPDELDLQTPASRGLRIVRRLTDQFKGSMHMDPGDGTTLRILLFTA